MKEKRNQLYLPDDVVEQLELVSGQPIQAILDSNHLVIQKQAERAIRDLPSWIMFLATALSALIFFIIVSAQKIKQVPLTGDYSITAFLLTLGAGVGLLFFTVHFILNRANFLGDLKGRVFWRILPVVVASFAVIIVLGLLGFAWLLGQLFAGASFDQFTSTVLFAVMTYAVIVVFSQLAKSIKSSWLTSLFTVIMMSGVLIAMATNSSRRWWQVNLSFLGTQRARDSWQFNITLMLSALILIALVDYLFVALSQRYGKSWRLIVLRVLLTLLGLDLGAVGYFPNDASSHAIHTDMAGYLVYIIIALIVGVRWLLPNITKDFMITSYVIGGALVLLEIAFQVIHYLSLTAFEMSAFLLAFTWLVLLLNRLEALITPEKRVVYLQLED